MRTRNSAETERTLDMQIFRSFNRQNSKSRYSGFAFFGYVFKTIHYATLLKKKSV